MSTTTTTGSSNHLKKISAATFCIIGLTKLARIEFLLLDWKNDGNFISGIALMNLEFLTYINFSILTSSCNVKPCLSARIAVHCKRRFSVWRVDLHISRLSCGNHVPAVFQVCKQNESQPHPAFQHLQQSLNCSTRKRLIMFVHKFCTFQKFLQLDSMSTYTVTLELSM